MAYQHKQSGNSQDISVLQQKQLKPKTNQILQTLFVTVIF